MFNNYLFSIAWRDKNPDIYSIFLFDYHKFFIIPIYKNPFGDLCSLFNWSKCFIYYVCQIKRQVEIFSTFLFDLQTIIVIASNIKTHVWDMYWHCDLFSVILNYGCLTKNLSWDLFCLFDLSTNILYYCCFMHKLEGRSVLFFDWSTITLYYCCLIQNLSDHMFYLFLIYLMTTCIIAV